MVAAFPVIILNDQINFKLPVAYVGDLGDILTFSVLIWMFGNNSPNWFSLGKSFNSSMV